MEETVIAISTRYFSRSRQKDRHKQDELTEYLYQQIGQLKVELDRLKKNLDLTLEQKRRAIEPRHRQIAIYRQCELPGLSRSSLYYKSLGSTHYNKQLMKLISGSDNGLVQPLKVEVYLWYYRTVAERRYNLNRYFEFYNNQRLHQALGNTS